jgi:hypothetical protein
MAIAARGMIRFAAPVDAATSFPPILQRHAANCGTASTQYDYHDNIILSTIFQKPGISECISATNK